MRLRKLLAITLVLALSVCFATVSANAEDGAKTKWIQVWDRGGDFCGVQFELSTFVEQVERATEGFYEWIISAEGGHEILGNAYKILTQDGAEDGEDGKLPFKRFTSRQAVVGPATLHTLWEDTDGDAENGPEVGLIPADFIMTAAKYGQRMRFCTQDDPWDFIVTQLVIKHYLNGEDGEGTVIYDMATDPAIQDAQIGDSFDGGGLGLIRSGTASFLIVDEDNKNPEPILAEEPADEEPADEPAADESSDEATAEAPAAEPASAEPVSDSGSNTVIIVIIAVVVVAAVAVVGFVLIKGKKK